MPIPEGMRTSLNAIRETLIQTNTLYAEQIDEILPSSDIGSFAQPLLTYPSLMNAFMSVLAQKIVYTQIDVKLFRNPLQVLEGDELPIGAIGEEIYINPAKGRKFNVDDFAGLLARYESDVKVQYMHLNSDIQYPVTITRSKLKDAFTSWENLNSFIDGITQSLYNGAYIDRYNMTKALVTTAYSSNNVQIEVVTEPSTEATAKAFLTKARAMFLNFQLPSSNYNAWAKVGAYGRAIKSWSNREDIVFLIRNDLASYIDVNVLASAFNIDKTTLMGNIIYVDNFDVYDGDELVVDGSNILGIMADRRWFRIRPQELVMDEFYNANNRTWQMYLNDVRMYQYSLFANAVVFATSMPTVTATAIEFADSTAFEIEEGEKVTRKLTITPVNATSTVTFTSSDSTVVKVTKISNTEVEIEGVSDSVTPVTITATCGNLTDTISVTCVAGE